MAYIFLDESGDLGFSKGSSRWYVITLVLTKNHRRLERVVKKVRKQLRKKYATVGELHAYHSQPSVRKKLLRLVNEIEDVQVFSIILNKEKVYIDLQNQKNYLYNYTANILLDRLSSKESFSNNEEIYLCVDRMHTNKFLQNNFVTYLEDQFRGRDVVNKIAISFKASHEDKCLQVADFISWSLFRKYERGDFEYYDIIKEKIIEERLLFP